MSLVSFHRALIVTAIVFCLGFAGWQVQAYRTTGDGAALLLGALFGLLGIGLCLYLARLASFLDLED